jgi:hypothetical protein
VLTAKRKALVMDARRGAGFPQYDSAANSKRLCDTRLSQSDVQSVEAARYFHDFATVVAMMASMPSTSAIVAGQPLVS